MKAQKVAKADWKEGFKKKQVGIADMTMLSKVNNDAINDNLKKRFENAEIYTYIGHVLISVNPFKDLGIYTDEILHSYTGKNRLEMPPHVYAVAESAYYNMNSYKENQCIIISGESGAGKTEAAKRIMQYIATVSGGATSSIQEIKDMVLATNPLLESFGCAKTLKNNNSSRHGKYLEIQFNNNGEPVGAVITNYLLEKGRVVGQIENERNFHVFYQFTKAASPEYQEQFGIQGPESYLYTSKSNCLDVDGIDDNKDYSETLEAMEVIGLQKHEQDDIFRMLAIILWLGNVLFDEDDDGNSVISDENVTNFIAYIMEVEPAALNKVLTSRMIETSRGGRRGSVYEVPLNPIQASAVRDALAKAIYNNLFEWIVERVNQALRSRSQSSFVIGVLDIYGFEIFEENSFEQLCINYVNEKLQQIFIELTLKAEQEEYVKEKIEWTPIEFFNNKIVCDLIEEKRPPGNLSSNPHFESRGNKFLIKHYAGEVLYTIPGMTDKNKDQLVKDLLELIASSENKFLCAIFPNRIDKDSKKRPPTASDKIKLSANDLVRNLMQAQPSYIRTIKPNQNKSPSEYDSKMVLHQIKYLGLNENIRVRRAGFAYRQTFEKFFERFYLLSKKTSYAGDCVWQGDQKTGTERILKDCGIPAEEWQMGVTKAFIRHPETIWALEHLRDRYWHNMAMRIQRSYRNYVRYKNECARRIQRCWTKNKDQIIYVQLRDYGHSILGERKERRRMSLLSMRKFMGDYLFVNDNSESGETLRNVCNLGANELVAFSFKIQLLVARLGRSSKPSPRIFIMTDKAIYIVISTIEKKLLTMNVERNIPLGSITGVSLSNLRDDWVVLHLNNPTKELGDPIFSCFFKTEFLVHLLQRTGSKVQINIASQIEYCKKLNKTATIKFVKDENIKRNDLYKSHIVSVPSGEPPSSLSDPPCPKKEPPPKPITSGKLLKAGGPPKSKPTPSVTKKKPPPAPSSNTAASNIVASKAVARRKSTGGVYNFVTEDAGELPFKPDDLLEILEKDDNGWWLAKKDGQQGWVPSNYLEEVKVTPKPNPALPARRKPPPPAAIQEKKVPQREVADEEVEQHPISRSRFSASHAASNKSYDGSSSQVSTAPVAVFPGMAPVNSASGVPPWKAALEAKKAAAKAANQTESTESDRITTARKVTGLSKKPPPPVTSKPIIPPKPLSGDKPPAPPRPGVTGSKPPAPPRPSGQQMSLAEAVGIYF
ncbi:14409_t:CDS:10 [Funneliformis mosseae]|uniref:14409_t:CDS:1 n=1 Tax=Funneliformis mosseae TaxID=27381 RepID=A0A9N9CV73_FUNMO|nr:14409_t:CDS:10 [Funneliformis mosseae]